MVFLRFQQMPEVSLLFEQTIVTASASCLISVDSLNWHEPAQR